eukprot:GGOE01003591.1.p1 GENE.GGOE01003591.1~~GGOE01003591.1.p1  ORF type:complete len:424 (-),score=97.95 GGOE01003591.1:308-1579(-)
MVFPVTTQFLNTIQDVLAALEHQEQDLANCKAMFKQVKDEVNAIEEASKTCQYLKVGGAPFHASLRALQCHSPHMLSILTSNTFGTETDADEHVCIDRDQQWFPTILQYLRDGEMLAPDDHPQRTVLCEELAFYSIAVSTPKLAVIRQHLPEESIRFGTFDPVSLTWSPRTSGLDAFSAVCSCSAPPHVYAIGKLPSDVVMLGEFDVALQTFTCLTSVSLTAHDARIDGWAIMVVVGDLVLVLPKRNSDASPLVFDRQKQAWVAHRLERLPPDAACSIGDRVYAIDAGGRFYSAQPTQSPWHPLPPLPTRRWKVTLIAWENKVLALGGLTYEGPSNVVDLYDPETGCWSSLPPMLCGRFDAAVSVLGGCIYAIGGHHEGLFMEKYDPIRKMWQGVRQPSCPAFYGDMFAVASLNGMMTQVIAS